MDEEKVKASAIGRERRRERIDHDGRNVILFSLRKKKKKQFYVSTNNMKLFKQLMLGIPFDIR